MRRIFLDAKSDSAQRSFMNMAARAAFHLCFGRIGSISIFTGQLYGLMAARTQTSPGVLWLPQLLYGWAECHHPTVRQGRAGGGPGRDLAAASRGVG